MLLDANGQPVANAVIAAKPLGPDGKPIASRVQREKLQTIAQADRQFKPLVTAVQTGTAIAFPNDDDIHHNVYSISRAKRFQLPLYKDKAPDPVLFDQPGSVVLGCNIHDWMVAYVRVLDTPHFGKTDRHGNVVLEALEAREYEVEVWHPRKRRRQNTTSRHVAGSAGSEVIELRISMTPQWRSQATGGSGSD